VFNDSRERQECREGDRESCAELAAIARSEKDWKERKRLVEMLSDDKLLVEFARHDDNLTVRGSAIDRMTDQAVLADIAKKDHHMLVRRDAEERLRELEKAGPGKNK
jgi:hypothetical protein